MQKKPIPPTALERVYGYVGEKEMIKSAIFSASSPNDLTIYINKFMEGKKLHDVRFNSVLVNEKTIVDRVLIMYSEEGAADD